MAVKRWKFSKEVGAAAIGAAFTVLISAVQAYGIFYSVPSEIASVKSELKDAKKELVELRITVARIEERQKNDNRRASISD
jgi:hypothetical protein